MPSSTLNNALLCITCILISRAHAQTHVCKQLSDCKCQYEDDGMIVDITSLGNKDGTPRFKDIPSPDGYVYSYNPCGSFNEDICKGAAACRKNRLTNVPEIIASADTVQFTYDELTGDTVVGYAAGMLAEIHTFVYLMCDKSANPGPPQLFPNGTQSQNLYVMMLYSACACGDRCNDQGIIDKQDGDDTVMRIKIYLSVTIFSVFIVFCLSGILLNKFGITNETNSFWKSRVVIMNLGPLIVDGFRFTLSGCRMHKDGYASV